MNSFTVTLPAPPSTNNLFINVRGKGRVKSMEYRSWLSKAAIIINASRAGKRITIEGPVNVTVRIGACNEARDADNFLKACCDLMVATGVIKADNLRNVHEATAKKAFGEVQDGWVSVQVEALQ